MQAYFLLRRSDETGPATQDMDFLGCFVVVSEHLFMSVRMRHTSSHTKNRRSHHALVGTNVVVDKESGALRLPHRLDESTGMYRGKQIVAKREIKKEEKKKKARAAEHEHVQGENTNPPAAKHIKTEEREKKQGLLGRMNLGKGKATARSGMGGNAGA